MCNVETELGKVCSSQQDPGGAWRWYNKALLSLDSLMEGVLDAEVITKHTEAKGLFERYIQLTSIYTGLYSVV